MRKHIGLGGKVHSIIIYLYIVILNVTPDFKVDLENMNVETEMIGVTFVIKS